MGEKLVNNITKLAYNGLVEVLTNEVNESLSAGLLKEKRAEDIKGEIEEKVVGQRSL